MIMNVHQMLAEAAPSRHPKAVVPALDAGTHCQCRSTGRTPGATARPRAPMDPGVKPRDDIGGWNHFGGRRALALDNQRGGHA